MFQLEIISLLNELKKSQDNVEFIKIKNSIANLIEQNKSEYFTFLKSQAIDEKTKKILDDCEAILLHKTEEKKPKNDDFEVLKKFYSSWEEEYIKNNKIPNQKCEDIVNQIINFYALNRMVVIEQLFKINDSQNFEDFKMMIKNYLRKYFAQKIDTYYESDTFKQKGFFEKRQKRKEIIKLLNEIGKYEFNVENILEVVSK